MFDDGVHVNIYLQSLYHNYYYNGEFGCTDCFDE